MQQQQQPQRTCIALHSLIDYVPINKPRNLNLAQVTADRFNSVFYMYDVNEMDVLEVCQLLSYYLRARFDVTFDREPQTDNERSGHNLFYSLKDFRTYYEAFKSFLQRMYRENLQMSERIDQFVAASEEELRSGSGNIALAAESLQILRQFKDVRGMFNEFFMLFQSDRFDPGVLYERLFLERTCSAQVPLVIPAASLGSLATMFDQLSFLCVHSVDYCNSVMPAIVSAGVVIYSVLYLSGSGNADNATTPTSWGKINTTADGMPQWMHTQVESPAYQREIQQLPAELFDPAAGDTYVKNHDFIATLLVQTLNRLFTRLIEWPLRDDVSSWMTSYLQCDNMVSFLNDHGRHDQRWIRFKRKRNNEDKTAPPTIYVMPQQLCDLYNEVALAARKLPPQQRGAAQDGGITASLVGKQTCGGAPIALPPEKAHVRERMDTLNAFKSRYMRYWLNGVRGGFGNKEFRDMYRDTCCRFVMATGGYRGLEIAQHAADNHHAYAFEPCEEGNGGGGGIGLIMDRNMQSLRMNGCLACSDLLVPNTVRDIFDIERWLEQIHNMVFPYNLTCLTQDGKSEHTMKETAKFKMLEGFALRRLTVDRAKKLLDFFEQNRPICQFVVTQNDMIALWTKASNQLAFFKDFLGLSGNDDAAV